MRWLLVLSFLASTFGVQFFLRQGEEVCLSQDVSRAELLMGEFVVEPQQARVAVVVTDPLSAVVYSKSNSGEGKFAFTSSREGEYRACFTNSGLHQKTVKFHFKTGVHAKDYSDVAKKNNLKPLEVELKRLEEQVANIHEEMKRMKDRGQEAAETTESTHSRVMW
eukprot:CAMPEP_0175119012 /NCGR_PEP_ID=MMETSP0086_2-20121207/19923_1 /TAXON_ID=136419 /ORGANISM="Unknown Unknown, Strain D1" /LENGTH=164 /DNA_ID=CAMNT_0016400221 /DNA_START=7 /DNA_END=498 /DNA_ORIENTATION=+